MEPILNFAQLTAHLKKLNHRKRIAVVCANDPNTEYAISRALEEGIAEFLMIGDSTILKKYPTLKQYPEYVKTIHIENSDEAAREAVRIVREGGADILMKGIINTDNLLHAILDKEKGLLPKGKILTHLAVMEIPTYHKLLFFSDAAVIPRPTLQQRIEMIWYAICTCRLFGIEQPRVALIHCTEKVSAKFPHSLDYVNIVELAEAGEFGNVIIDGPLAGSSVPLTGAEIGLGRAASNTVVLDDEFVSSHHSRVYRDPSSGQWAIEDLNSTNGTVVNQQRISQPTILPARVPVRIGATTFELR